MEQSIILNNIIRQRRSIKPENFSNQKVVREILDQLLANANWAPTHAFTEPWRFVIFAEEGRKRLGEFEANHYKQKTAAENFQQKKYDKALNRPRKATYILAICMKRQTEGKKIIAEVEEIAAVSCAIQNMWLTAHAYGLAAYWGSGGATYSDEMKTFLGLAPQDRCLGFFYIGYSQEQPKSRRISNIEAKTTWVTA